jgi:flavin reductase (DIM6/NTAB) family NADH-FMN oxidoreductase RutF
MIIEFDQIEGVDRYKVMSTGLSPRPIAWISTYSETEGAQKVNLAPFSYITPLSSTPPSVVVSIGHKKGDKSPKDTMVNLLNGGRCTITLPTLELKEAMELSGAEEPYEISESEKYTIEMQELDNEYPPMVKGAKIAFMCSFLQQVELEGSPTVPLILKIEKVYVDDEHIDEGLHIDWLNFARVGKDYYRLEKVNE